MEKTSHAAMIRIESGEFAMGSVRFYEEERPVKRVQVESFWIDETPVTNRAFAQFVRETEYVTLAERVAKGLPAGGSAVFSRPPHRVNLDDPAQWWEFREGACWHRPLGAGSTIAEIEDHPVVHIAYEDAFEFAAWAGKSLPTEAEWEFASRGGLDGEDYAWGNVLAPEGMMLANYWQGEFPIHNTMEDGWEQTSPVRSYPGNGYGLFDMIGNVWEWTSDPWKEPGTERSTKPACCSAKNSRHEQLMVMKGGSYLCAKNFCQRYRPAARHAQPADKGTGHIGFRCVVRD